VDAVWSKEEVRTLPPQMLYSASCPASVWLKFKILISAGGSDTPKLTILSWKFRGHEHQIHMSTVGKYQNFKGKLGGGHRSKVTFALGQKKKKWSLLHHTQILCSFGTAHHRCSPFHRSLRLNNGGKKENIVKQSRLT